MTNQVYAIGLQGHEPPAQPAVPARGSSPEERASYRESVSKYREQVRRFCDSLAAELTGTDRPPLRSYLHAAQDGTPLLMMSVLEHGSDAATELERAGAEFQYTEDPEPSGRGRFSEPVYDLLRISTAKARTTICRLVLSFLSQFFQRRRHLSSQPKDRSTTHRCGSTTKVCSSLRFTTSTEAPNKSCTAAAKGSPL